MSLEGAIGDKVRTLVAAHQEELRRLVDAEVDRQLGELVAERLDARNGNGSPATKVCAGLCGRTLPVSAFERHRGRCRDCRRAEARHRQQQAAAAAAEGPPPANPPVAAAG